MSLDSALDHLEAGLILGPEHHRFRLTELMGPHPLGLLWRAEDQSTPTRASVSLLFLPQALSQQPEFIERLRRLISLTRKIQHPHLLPCAGVFPWRGHYFLAFAAVEGRSLAQVFEKQQIAQLSPEQKQGLCLQLGKALHAFHKQLNTAYTSLSPALVFLNPGQGVLLMPLPWRALLDDYYDLCKPPLGYRAYQAPEAFQGQTTRAGDVYALAALIYHLYQGKPAFREGEGEPTRYQRELKAPSGLNAEQWQVLQHALSPEPDARPASMPIFLQQLFAGPDKSLDELIAAKDTPATESKATDVEEALSPRADAPAPETAHSEISTEMHANASTTTYVANEKRARLQRWLKSGGIPSLTFILGLILGWSASQLFKPSSPDTNPSAHLAVLEAEQIEGQAESLEHPATDSESAIELAENSAASLESLTNLPEPSTHSNAPLTLFQDPFQEASSSREISLFAPEMVILPPGSFRMGDLDGRGDDNEQPVREVNIARPFALSRYEITFAEYDRFAQETGRRLPADEGWGRGSRPVIHVSWNDARAYTRWLAMKTGQPYRLPTEAEWEYAARAGSETAFWWGNELRSAHAVCDGCGTEWDGRMTAPVGQTPANPWGLYDMHGNVDEWVEDCYSEDYRGLATDGQAQLNRGCEYRVMRGGSWFDIDRVIRSASRYRHPPNATRNTWGFRIALDLPAPSD
ncbi:SUMF1/EgtB/PvdO family nonheme iron enzyme [Nitrincola tapanii]|uniref:Protein kinase domain-containing protein n=1 Tax=Nitrincola tapanii TaxID=1708751 RepID=A0A5A9W206_9GAMM|nr:SUMF1/EgtB/PvdO family nonheme iron enzyme [Nitrincola tapanii]KAA0874125.1 hypothetical protein E1H14_10130 [Nitrincola tapanii]